MRRRVFRAIAALAGLSGMAVTMLAAAQAANAVEFNYCETNGNFCIGAPDLGTFAPVVETGAGRAINLLGVSGGYWKLQFNAAPSQCVAATDNGNGVVIHHCNGGLGTLWQIINNANGHLQFWDREHDTLLAGRNNGTQYKLITEPAEGWFYNFDG